jgi:pyridoxal biosynthesis lyase PdxS
VNEPEVLLPAEFALRAGVPTRVVIQAMHEKRVPRVKLADGTLGIPADALDTFQVPTGG